MKARRLQICFFFNVLPLSHVMSESSEPVRKSCSLMVIEEIQALSLSQRYPKIVLLYINKSKEKPALLLPSFLSGH